MTRVQDLLDKAAAQTSLTDFGAETFLSGLGVLVESLDAEARLNDAGRHVVFGKLVKLLTFRLEVEDWYRRHPEIDDEVIAAPLIGVGLPRTGSTALSNLLNEDPHARSLLAWQAMQPCPPPATVPSPDPRIEQSQKTIELQMQFAPQLAAMVPTDAQGPAECLELMALSFASHVFPSLAQIPTYYNWLLYEADMVATYRYQRRVLKLLQWGLPTLPWRLKAPSHLCHVKELMTVFPDARLVSTHRDPAAVMTSCCGLYDAVISMFTESVDRAFLGEQNLRVWSLGMQRMMDFRATGGEQLCYDIDHRDVQRQPIAAVEGLYEWLGVPVSPQFRSGMQRWWRDKAADREQASYESLESYGLTAEQVRDEFAAYSERFVPDDSA